ncbi:hypothetical protein [Erythrobacter sp.]|jgi:hypothetical protein|uniref:hypothetical protein n=1 Tax=Erythrobacter sp. TaxID=1042 RepID=UPI002ECA74BD|nr:hypothetical protein [Erythrobacter sp.]
MNAVRLALGSAVALSLSAASLAQTDPDTGKSDFCARLAANIGVEKTKIVDGNTQWTANALNFGQRVLFGGTAVTSVRAEPAEATSVEEYQRALGMCVAEGKGAACRLIGPVDFTLGWKGESTTTRVLDGERALVRVENTKTSCHAGVH